MSRIILCPCCGKRVRDTDETCVRCRWQLTSLRRLGVLTEKQKREYQSRLEECRKRYLKKVRQHAKARQEGGTPSQPSSGARTPNAQYSWIGHPQAIRALAISPDQTMLVSGSQDSTIKLWSMRDWSDLDQGRGSEHTGSVTGVVFVDKGQRIISIGLDGSVLQWRLSGRRGLRGWSSERRLAQLDQQLTSIAHNAGSNSLAVGDKDGSIFIWDRTRSLSKSRPLWQHGGGVETMALAPGKSVRLASGGSDGTLRLWGARRAQVNAPLWSLRGAVHSVCFSTGGDLLAAGGTRKLRIWDLRRNAWRASSDAEHDVRAVAFLDSERVVCGMRDGSIKILDAGPGQWVPLGKSLASIQSLVVCPLFNCVVTGNQRGVLERWSYPNRS